MNRRDKEEGRGQTEGKDLPLKSPQIIVNQEGDGISSSDSVSEIYQEALRILRYKFPRPKNKTPNNTTGSNPTSQIEIENKTDEINEEKKPEKTSDIEEYIPARMINEYVYCPRLFYYEFVDGVFKENADTLRGSAIHSRVDKGKGEMPVNGGGTPGNGGDSEKRKPDNNENNRDTIHSRSVTLSSDSLKVIAKLDLVEITAVKEGDDKKYVVCPVDYKAGEPKKQSDGLEIWDADKVQLALQCLLLRENGYECNEGIIYYSSTKQKAHLQITDDLIKWVIEQVNNARLAAKGEIPPPLAGSSKCIRCSLAPVCLPDETNFLRNNPFTEEQENKFKILFEKETASLKRDSISTGEEIRRLISPRDDTRALYLTTQGLKVGRRDETLEIKEENKLVETVRLKDVSHVALFGNIQITTQAIQALCEADIPVTYFSTGGWFYGITRGHSIKNVFLRIKQFQVAADEQKCSEIASKIIFAKIRNQRTMLMRNHVEPPKDIIRKLKILSDEALKIRNVEELLGMEGIAANLYFENFGGLIKVNDEIGLVVENAEQVSQEQKENSNDAPMTFDFRNRNRRPPKDPVNALLSLAYSLLAKDCTIAALSVGFDPYVGFYHRPRYGRPALALDLMEEFRPLIAESAVITAINNRVISLKDFVRAGKSVNLTPEGRKKFFYIYEQRINTLITHPVFDYKVTYRRSLELQARILARTLIGEISNYVPFLTR
ncbi:MAG: CRISPR-associated endonuclease Cas4g/Cas1g [Verrucomicrobiia bacterium]